MSGIAELLTAAGVHYGAGRLIEAAAVYQQVLQVEPTHAFALHQLGAIALDTGQLDRARQYLTQAVAADPGQAAYHANLSAACSAQHDWPAAEQSLHTALQLQPDLHQARMMLARLDETQGRLADAANGYRKVAEALPASADAQFDLGNVLQQLGQFDAAEDHYIRALVIAPHFVAARVNLATLLKNRDQIPHAIAHYRAALADEPRNATALTNLATALDRLGETAQALDSARAAVAADPASVVAQSNLGSLLQKQGRLDEAELHLTAALAANARFVPAWLGLAAVRYQQGRLDDAVAACQRVISLEPGSARAHLNLGRMLCEQGRRSEALEHCRQAIELDPQLPSAHGVLATALHLLGRAEESIAARRQELLVQPKSALEHSNLLYGLNYLPESSASEIFVEHRRWAERHADPLTALSPRPANDRSPERKLRLGYVSPHFFGHAVNFFVEPILTHHDRQQFEVFCYSDVFREDETTRRLRGAVDHWRTILGQGHAPVAEQVTRDQIDILVDLTGHIGENRLSVFARKPAPIQITYIGYQNTTGMLAMDYRLTDAHADPPGMTEHWHTEQLVRLPRAFFCYLPSSDAPPVAAPPAVANGFVTFGSFNSFAKINVPLLETWANLLARAPSSRLMILADDSPLVRQFIDGVLSTRGIVQDRWRLVGRLPRVDYLRLMETVDIALDPFPFNGHTTTCDCLWQGLPVVTLAGETYVSRFGGSALVALGKSEWIANSREEYLQIAVDLARDVGRLVQIRAELRPTMAASPLLNFAGFTRNLEAEYRSMWRRWCEENLETKKRG